ncbi:MAG TPA: PaaI family thioesterase [candidate division WOR-3 bacterium]|uniref:Acyl-coenzyme A thioesterase THEM4 n=1 Tax=candidate division WOR-3 bacterium TaxID=2052148 RepID=A0A9C9EM86_UNCW3|nr:PaaI family thioesterase [candidate division WOR-3 bacterium]
MNTDFLMDDRCFACGAANSNGLQLQIEETADGVRAVIRPPKWSQGYKEMVHGGIISTILDEMTVWAAFKKGHRCVTAELTVRIKKAMKVAEEYLATGRVLRIKHRLVEAESEITDRDNETVAFARAKLIKIQ